MSGISRRLWVAALFTVMLISLVNVAWWVYYQRTEQLLEDQLNHRLATTAAVVARLIRPEQISALVEDEFETYLTLAGMLEDVREADSLSELFILNENYKYLLTTLIDPDSLYFLRALNGPFIDSLFFDPTRDVIVPPAYRSGSLTLKSAFATLSDSSGIATAVLGVEADTGYYESLADLNRIFTYATVLSLAGGLLLGLLFIFLERRLGGVERQLALAQTHTYLGRMVAVVAHELKNPLMIMRASAERLTRKIEADEARYIIEEVDRLNGIVTGYLEFARAGKGLVERDQLETFDLTELVSELRSSFTEQFGKEGLVWLKLPLPDRLEITGYRRSLRQVLLNLLINGAEACLSANKPLAVGIGVERNESEARIRVVDRGPGLRKSDIPNLFEPFHTTKHGGSGLGLYLAKKIIEEMGGSIEINSIQDDKTEVRIEIPIDRKT